MNANELNKLAHSKGYFIGRLHSNVYYYGRSTMFGTKIESTNFCGTWNEFVKFIKAL